MTDTFKSIQETGCIADTRLTAHYRNKYMTYITNLDGSLVICSSSNILIKRRNRTLKIHCSRLKFLQVIKQRRNHNRLMAYTQNNTIETFDLTRSSGKYRIHTMTCTIGGLPKMSNGNTTYMYETTNDSLLIANGHVIILYEKTSELTYSLVRSITFSECYTTSVDLIHELPNGNFLIHFSGKPFIYFVSHRLSSSHHVYMDVIYLRRYKETYESTHMNMISMLNNQNILCGSRGDLYVANPHVPYNVIDLMQTFKTDRMSIDVPRLSGKQEYYYNKASHHYRQYSHHTERMSIQLPNSNIIVTCTCTSVNELRYGKASNYILIVLDNRLIDIIDNGTNLTSVVDKHIIQLIALTPTSFAVRTDGHAVNVYEIHYPLIHMLCKQKQAICSIIFDKYRIPYQISMDTLSFSYEK